MSHRRIRLLQTILLFTLITSSALAGDKITAKNWAKQPRIIEVKKIYANNQAKRGKWKKDAKTFEYCRPYVDTERALISDEKGAPRIYVNGGGSDDSSVTLEHHYDENGKLRFVFIKAGAVNGSSLEHRIYLDAAGKRLWELHQYTEGPGYTFPNPWPKEHLAFDPKAAFAAKNECAD